MIPKIIHCIWLSGEEKPKVYQDCIATWKKYMPDYEIIEWDMHKFPISSVKYVQQACKAKKWAYAADYIRLYALYNYGGIYLDMDVIVYKSFDPFLKHSAFSCIELYPEAFYKSIHKKEIIGLGIEAAIMGSIKGHSWIKDAMDYYKDRNFVNDPKYYYDYLMPRVLTRISRQYGFKYVPVYQILEKDVHIYPADVFSSIYDFNILNKKRTINSIKRLGESPIRYSFHLCTHSWWEGEKRTFYWKIKNVIYRLLIQKIERNNNGKKDRIY